MTTTTSTTTTGRPRQDRAPGGPGPGAVRKNEETKEMPSLPPAPPAVDRVMFHGLLGELVELAAPSTEADPAGVYVSLLASVGAAIGNGPYVPIGNTRHPLLIWPLLFGRTGSGRKGEATETADVFLRTAITDTPNYFVTGLSSGEGLIERIRDPRDADDRGGSDDKRLRVLEPEFGTVLARTKREGSTLGAILREAWSGKPLALMNRAAITASSSHIAIIGHITPKEFRLKLAEAEMAGGTFNRFLPIYVEQSKRLPIPEGIHPDVLAEAAARLRDGINAARQLGRIELDLPAAKLWTEELYDEFCATDDEDASWTEFARRGAPYCRRIAALHAVLEGRDLVAEPDLAAAAALVRYAIGSAKYVLDRTIRDPKLDRLRRALDGAGTHGLSRQDISGLFGRNLTKKVLDTLLDEVITTGAYEAFKRPAQRGRPAEMYRRTTEPPPDVECP